MTSSFRVSNQIYHNICASRRAISPLMLRLVSYSNYSSSHSIGGGAGASDLTPSSSPFSGSIDGDDDRALLEKLKLVFELEKRKPNSEEFDNSAGDREGERRAMAEKRDLLSPPGNADVVLRKMKETVLIPRTVAMLQGLYSDGQEYEAMKVFDVMRERGTIPEVVIYTAVVEHFCEAQKLDDATRIFKEMKSNGVVANAFSYGVLIQALCKDKRVNDALEFCLEMVEAGQYPNSDTFTALLGGFCTDADKTSIEKAAAMLHGLCRDGLVQEAMKLFDLVRATGTIPEVVTYTSLVEQLCNDQKHANATMMFKKMEGNGIVPNAFSYGVLVQGFCKGKRLDDALEFCLEMIEAGHSPNLATLTGLVDGFCRERGLEAAQMMIKNLKDNGLCFEEKGVRGFLEKKGPFSPLVWRAIFGARHS